MTRSSELLVYVAVTGCIVAVVTSDDFNGRARKVSSHVRGTEAPWVNPRLACVPLKDFMWCY
jgi:hypothetical protein